jgi:hypothetical protein
MASDGPDFGLCVQEATISCLLLLRLLLFGLIVRRMLTRIFLIDIACISEFNLAINTSPNALELLAAVIFGRPVARLLGSESISSFGYVSLKRKSLNKSELNTTVDKRR